MVLLFQDHRNNYFKQGTASPFLKPVKDSVLYPGTEGIEIVSNGHAQFFIDVSGIELIKMEYQVKEGFFSLYFWPESPQKGRKTIPYASFPQTCHLKNGEDLSTVTFDFISSPLWSVNCRGSIVFIGTGKIGVKRIHLLYGNNNTAGLRHTLRSFIFPVAITSRTINFFPAIHLGNMALTHTIYLLIFAVFAIGGGTYIVKKQKKGGAFLCLKLLCILWIILATRHHLAMRNVYIKDISLSLSDKPTLTQETEIFKELGAFEQRLRENMQLSKKDRVFIMADTWYSNHRLKYLSWPAETVDSAEKANIFIVYNPEKKLPDHLKPNYPLYTLHNNARVTRLAE